MNIHQLCVRVHRVPLSAAVMAMAIGLAAWSLTSPSVRALSNAQTFLSGGGSMAAGSTLWTHPGSSNAYGNDFPNTGLGEQAAQIRMSGGGVLKFFAFKLTTATTPSAGSLTATVRINGDDTALTCTLFATGQCVTSGATAVNVPGAAKLAVRASQTISQAPATWSTRTPC